MIHRISDTCTADATTAATSGSNKPPTRQHFDGPKPGDRIYVGPLPDMIGHEVWHQDEQGVHEITDLWTTYDTSRDDEFLIRGRKRRLGGRSPENDQWEVIVKDDAESSGEYRRGVVQ